MSAGREFQVDGAATEKVRRASSVCMRGTTSIGASEERTQSPRWCTGLYQFAEIRWSGCDPHLVSQYSQFIGDPLPQFYFTRLFIMILLGALVVLLHL